jgi:hypothetical protein
MIYMIPPRHIILEVGTTNPVVFSTFSISFYHEGCLGLSRQSHDLAIYLVDTNRNLENQSLKDSQRGQSLQTSSQKLIFSSV